MRRLDDHLAHCNPCRRIWRSMQEASTVFENKVMARPSSGFTARVMQSVRQMPHPATLAHAPAPSLAGWLKIVLALMVLGAAFGLTSAGVVGWLFASGRLSGLGSLSAATTSVLGSMLGFGRGLAISLWLVGSAVFEAIDGLIVVGVVIALLAMTLAWVHLVLAQAHESSQAKATSS